MRKEDNSMRDYDLEEFLMHYGVPGMKRPRGLKYKTRGSTSLYANRRAQMYRRNTGESKEGSTEGSKEDGKSTEWRKWKMLNDTKNNIPGTGTNDGKKPSMPSVQQRRPMPKLERNVINSPEGMFYRTHEKFKNMFKPKQKKYKDRYEKAEEREDRLLKNLKENHLTRYGLRYAPNVNSRFQNPKKKIGYNKRSALMLHRKNRAPTHMKDI